MEINLGADILLFCLYRLCFLPPHFHFSTTPDKSSLSFLKAVKLLNTIKIVEYFLKSYCCDERKGEVCYFSDLAELGRKRILFQDGTEKSHRRLKPSLESLLRIQLESWCCVP